MKNIIRLTESDIHRIVKESVETILTEVEGYKNTMDKAEKQFDQNTFMGRMRSRLQPKKYQQLQRIKGNANTMGQEAADNINVEREKIPLGSSGGFGVYDHTYPRWHEYAKQQGAADYPERPQQKDFGIDTSVYSLNTKDKNYPAYEKAREEWDSTIFPDANKKGKDLYQQRTALDRARVDKYGTGGRYLKPIEGYETSSFEDWQDKYKDQQARLGR